MIKIAFDGKTYNSAKEFAVENGISTAHVYNAVRRGLSGKEIIDEARGRPVPAVRYHGREFKSVEAFAKACGKDVSTVTLRLNQGWNLDEAVDRVPRGYKGGAFVLPEGMKPSVLAYGMGVDPADIRRWQAGKREVPQEAADLMDLWEEIGPEGWFEEVEHMTGRVAPEKLKDRAVRHPNLQGMSGEIIEVLADSPKPLMSDEIAREIQRLHPERAVKRRSIKTLLSRLKQGRFVIDSEVEGDRRHLWSLPERVSRDRAEREVAAA